MNFAPIIAATLVVGAVGLIIGILLGYAGQFFEVKIDPKQEAIRAALPGNNCGACGFPGCDGLAKAIFEGNAAYDTCPVGGARSAAAISEIMGFEGSGAAASTDREAAQAEDMSRGSAKSDDPSARAQTESKPAPKKKPPRVIAAVRPDDCVACHICENTCKFDAIHVPEDRPVIDDDKCVGCGMCGRECPQNVLEVQKREEVLRA